MSFHVYFDKQVHKKLKKISKQKKKKITSLNYAESNAHRKTNARGSFETHNFFLILMMKETETAILYFSYV